MSTEQPQPEREHPIPPQRPRPRGGLWLSSRGAVYLEDVTGKIRDRRGALVVGAVTVASMAGVLPRPPHHW